MARVARLWLKKWWGYWGHVLDRASRAVGAGSKYRSEPLGLRFTCAVGNGGGGRWWGVVEETVGVVGAHM